MTAMSPWNAEYNSAKGSLLAGDGTRPVVQTVGANGQYLTADSGAATGVSWQPANSGLIYIGDNPVVANEIVIDVAAYTSAVSGPALYGMLKLVSKSPIFPVTNGDDVIMTFSVDGGATYQGLGRYTSGWTSYYYTGGAPIQSSSTSNIILGKTVHDGGINGGVAFDLTFVQGASNVNGNLTSSFFGNVCSSDTTGTSIQYGFLGGALILTGLPPFHVTNFKITSSGVGGITSAATSLGVSLYVYRNT